MLGKKKGMMRIYDEAGEYAVVTVLEVGPCSVITKKNIEKDGYKSLQLGFEDIKEKKLIKPLLGFFKKTKANPKRYVREIIVDDENYKKFEQGQDIKINDMFKVGQFVDLSAISKGKGFSGVVKRHGFTRGPMAHGSRHHREPGSMGAKGPSRVFKGHKLPGRMGGKKATIQNLKIVKIEPEENLLFVKGAVPGVKEALVLIKYSVKKKK